ncbi:MULTISPECIES: Rha family transcriptional regulator [unclassified Pseudomonas]|uniref:Rha family transcriptional regulator n=1 Tax=unclassified Pseudomonas TaxID=196821 RepID=UPI000CD280FE|nr:MULTISPECIES: Rha family transcriptional regulator [unclassified Pseudomonas]POA52109.1 phage antirepressor protein [Pseudomonas sp. FW507-12TSA]
MQSQPNSSNTPTDIAPCFPGSQNVARTMSSVEIAELTGKLHKNVLADIRSMLAELEIDSADFSVQYKDTTGRLLPCFNLNREMTDTLLTGYSAKMRLAVVRRWRELEAVIAQPRELSRMDLIQLAFEAEQARLQLTIQVEAQASKIHSLENLFKEGMTHTQFCKGLNGVNVMQVDKYLESRNWLYNESKSGLRLRVASYARDKYMTEHQHEVTPHGKGPFISFMPVLLKKGAVRLYDLYLAGELPMKKTWDGLFTHDKALRGAS